MGCLGGACGMQRSDGRRGPLALNLFACGRLMIFLFFIKD
jgi:hypothetical protein